MSSRQKRRVEVPDELKDLLLRFTIAYLVEKPADLIGYALTFFANERDGRKAIVVSSVAPTTACQLAGPAGRCGRCAPEDEDEDEAGPVSFPKTAEQRARLRNALGKVLFFRELDEQQMNDVLDAMCEKTVRAKDYIVQPGAVGENFYVVESGVYECYTGEDRQHIHTFDNEGSFGGQGFPTDCPHSTPSASTIQAMEDGKLWAIERQTLVRIVRKSAGRKRKAHEALLCAVPMLKTLPCHERTFLAEALQQRTYARGEQILLQDDVADGLYFVEHGTVSVRIVEEEAVVELARVETGGFFGELALVAQWPQATSARAVTDIRVAFLNANAFLRLRKPCLDRLLGKSDWHLQHYFCQPNEVDFC